MLAEGKGERQSAPHLLRRILHEQLEEYEISVSGRARTTSGKGDLAKNIAQIVREMGYETECQGILVLIDSDRDCPVTLAKQLASKAVKVSTVPVVVVCAVREFENWFVCSFERICEKPAEMAPGRPCEAEDAKWFLKQCRRGGYLPTLHQLELVHKISFDLALARSPSLERMVRAARELVTAIRTHELIATPNS